MSRLGHAVGPRPIGKTWEQRWRSTPPFLLEPFQVALLPGWVPEREFGVVLAARPEIARFLVTQCPEVAGFVDSVIRRNEGAPMPRDAEVYGDTVVWTMADLLVYNKRTEVYDAQPFHNWDFAGITSLIDLKDEVVVDGGSGAGQQRMIEPGVSP